MAVEVHHPIAAIDGREEAHRVLEWIERHQVRKVTFVHVIDTRPMYRDAGVGSLPTAQAMFDLESEAMRLLDDVHRVAPPSISTVVRVLKAPRSRWRQLLSAVEGSWQHDALIVPTPSGPRLFDDTARLTRRLRARSPVPLIVLDASRTCAPDVPLLTSERSGAAE